MTGKAFPEMLPFPLRTLATLTCAAALTATVASAADAAPARPAAAWVSCSVSGPLAGMPFAPSPRDPLNPVYDFMQFTATRSSVFAGIAYRSASSDFYLLTRAPGKKPIVLSTVHYPYAHATPNAVTATGFTPRMNLVVAEQNTWYKPGRVAFGSYKGLYFTGRTAHTLTGHSGWISYMPTSVANDGRIAGWAATGSPTRPHYYVITWANEYANPVALADVGSLHPSVQMTGNGDIAWQGLDGHTVVRKADGSQHELDFGSRSASVNIWPAAASGTAFYSAATNGVVRWTVSGKTPAGAAIQGTRMTTAGTAASWVDTAGPRGDLITGMQTAVLHLPDGRQVAMPPQALPSSAQARTITNTGVVAFTSKTDRKVHFLACR